MDYLAIAKLRAQGSPNYVVSVGAIASGAEEYHDINTETPDAEKYDFMDSILITNNSAQKIEFRLNRYDVYPILGYQVQPITRRPCRFYTIKNVGALATVAGEVTVQYRRLPPEIIATTQVR